MMYRGGDWVPMLSIGVSAVLVIVLVFIATGILAERNARLDRQAQEDYWRGSAIYRICSNGTHIYRLRDGSFVGPRKDPVFNPETVC